MHKDSLKFSTTLMSLYIGLPKLLRVIFHYSRKVPVASNAYEVPTVLRPVSLAGEGWKEKQEALANPVSGWMLFPGDDF